MKFLLVPVIILTSMSSFAFTERTEFLCKNDSSITVQSSLMPDGTRFEFAYSSDDTHLNWVDCAKVPTDWSPFGIDSCFMGQNKMFFRIGNFGTLSVKENGTQFYTFCIKNNTVQ